MEYSNSMQNEHKPDEKTEQSENAFTFQDEIFASNQIIEINI